MAGKEPGMKLLHWGGPHNNEVHVGVLGPLDQEGKSTVERPVQESGTALHAAIVQAPEGTADNQHDMNNA